MTYLNRELSWIDFNERVLMEACSKTVPLLERLKFIGIVSSNFDEFFMVRVAGLQELFRRGEDSQDVSGLSIGAQLDEIARKTRSLFDIQEHALNTEILPKLKAEGLAYLKPEECTIAKQAFLRRYFYTNLYEQLTPVVLKETADLADTVDSIQLYSAFLLADKRTGEETLAFIEVPNRSRFVFLPESAEKAENQRTEFVLADEIIRFFGAELFSGFRVTGTSIFKINRSASMTVDDSTDDGFIQALQEILIQRRYSFAVRMTCSSESPALIRRMAELFGLEEKEVYLSDAPIGLASFSKIAKLDGFGHLLNKKWKYFPHPHFPKSAPLWDSIKTRDILLHVPYQSYKPVIAFLDGAAKDPDVVSIQMTLYRTSKASPIVHALEKAAKRGKSVTVFVEVKARFDEARNIGWVKRLQKDGVRVVYDLPHLKVHAKLLLIMRREAHGLQGYAHLATGNYNDTTAKLYADISLFTADALIVKDAQLIFERLCGSTAEDTPHCLVTAPNDLKRTLLNYIEREEIHARQGRGGRIIAKMNNLSHPALIDALYRASQAGVRIDLNVRGICMLIPGLPGISENIRVISIIDRYLEHSRIFYFENGGDCEWYLSSADWMPRNLERRVELLFPVLDKENRELLRYLISVYFSDTVKAFEMQPDGSWRRRSSQQPACPIRAQEAFQRFFNPKDIPAVTVKEDAV